MAASKVIKVVCSAAPGWKAAEDCCEALRKLSPVLQGRPVKKAHLERIYKIRLSRPDVVRSVIGADRLLADLAAWPDEDLTMAVLDSNDDGLAYCILLNDTADKLVTCFIAPDRGVAGKLTDSM